jgi:large subunit ribosomal protein L13
MERKTHKINAEGLVLGRLATRLSVLLRGKNKPGYSPHKDMGDFIVIENVDKIKVTGKKEEQKKYYRHSGYIGGLKSETYDKLKKRRPGENLKRAVYGMLPKNKLRPAMIKRLSFSKVNPEKE